MVEHIGVLYITPDGEERGCDAANIGEGRRVNVYEWRIQGVFYITCGEERVWCGMQMRSFFALSNIPLKFFFACGAPHTYILYR